MCSRIMCKNHAIMKREITINTPVVCGFAARPPSLARFILPRWESFVCSTLPSCVLTGRTVPQEFPRLFICDSFVRCRALPYRPKSSNPPIHPLARAAIPLGPPSRLPVTTSILPPRYFLIGCHYYPYFPALSIVLLSAKYKLSYAGMFPVTLSSNIIFHYFFVHLSFEILPHQLASLSFHFLSGTKHKKSR
jgi:hypothetical protein